MRGRARVKSVAYFGWRGMVGCEVLDLGEGPMTGLLGQSGAGKTTLALCLANALLPDRQALDIQPISEVRDNQSVGTDVLAGKIDPQLDYAYVVLDIVSRDGARLVAGIYVVKADGRAQLTRWLVRNASEELKLKDLIAVEDDEGYVSYPEFPRLKQVLATRGIDVETCQRIGDYGQALFDAGILPSSMRTRSDRTLYANLLKTTFRGGFSSEVASRLKDYLLTSQAQVPEIVRGLQECANEIFKTRSAISDADKELTLLKSTYGAGRDIVSRSVRWIIEEKEIFEEQIEQETELFEELNARSRELSEVIVDLEKRIVDTTKGKAEARESAWKGIKVLQAEVEKVRNKEAVLKDALTTARNEKSFYQKGKDIWQKVSGLTIAESYEEARGWLDHHVNELRQEQSRLKGEIEGTLENLQRIELGRPSLASESLQGMLGGDTLENAFRKLPEGKALASDLALSGITDGLVGVDKNNLETLSFLKTFPKNFWIGPTQPKVKAVEEIGDWLISPSLGGHVVTQKGRTTVFGTEAKARMRGELQDKLDDFQREASKLKREIELFTNHQDGIAILVDRHRDAIQFYLQNREQFELENRCETLEHDLKELSDNIALKQRALDTAEEVCKTIGDPFDKDLAQFHSKKSTSAVELTHIHTKLDRTQKLLGEYSERLESICKEEEDVKNTLADEFKYIFEYAQQLSDFDFDDTPDDLSEKIARLRVTLSDQVPERADYFDSLRSKTRVNTTSLWLVLVGLVRERINIDLANNDGMDLIQAAQDRRSELGNELENHEQNAKVKARGIANTIKTTINSAKLRIRKLSRLGHDIRFGNIVGVQLRLVEKSQMLELLDGFSGQLSLFSRNKPIDVAIKEWFDKGLGEEVGRHLTGEDLLDYRNYVNFAVEAKWRGGDWESVTSASLSGGESIGCGLALALMLMRSIAGRGDSNPELMTPLFTMDEIHRLDDAGVAMIVNLAKRENFQVVVTAQKIEPSYDCTLYNLTRLSEPDRLVVRGIKIKKKVAA